jgi:DNA mismatch repair protein MSH5
MQRRRVAGYLPGDALAHAFFRISRLEMFSLRNSMFINADTLQSLQIIETESHPNSHNQGPRSSGSKEGLSVYGIFHYLARTPQGKQRLRQWFLRPTMNMSILQERQRSIAIFARPDNATQTEDLGKNLRAMKHMRTHILKLRKGVSPSPAAKSGSSKPVWSTIRQFVFHALKVRDLVQEVISAEELSIRNKVPSEASSKA